MSIQPIDRKRRPIEDKILKLLVYGGQQMHGAQIIIEDIRQALKDFARQQRAKGRNLHEIIAFVGE